MSTKWPTTYIMLSLISKTVLCVISLFSVCLQLFSLLLSLCKQHTVCQFSSKMRVYLNKRVLECNTLFSLWQYLYNFSAKVSLKRTQFNDQREDDAKTCNTLRTKEREREKKRNPNFYLVRSTSQAFNIQSVSLVVQYFYHHRTQSTLALTIYTQKPSLSICYM